MKSALARIALLSLLLAPAGTLSAAPPDVPTKVEAASGQIVRIPVKSAAEIGFTPAFSDADAFFDELAPRDGQRRFLFQSAKPGSYSVVFWTKGETSGVACVITVSGATPGPTPPGPTPPGPTPPGPTPPGPTPPGPTPDADPALVASLRAAVAQDMAAKADVVTLGKVYLTYASLLEGVNDPNIRPKTYGQVVTSLVEASIAAGVPRQPALSRTRAVVAADVGEYPAARAVDDAFKAELVKKFKRVGAALTAAGA